MASLTDVVAPPNEEGTRATILRWCKLIGDEVSKDEPLVELETDKVTVEVAAPESGTLVEVLKAVNAEVNPDEVLARLRLRGDLSPRVQTAAPVAQAGAASATKFEPAAPLGAPAPLSPAVRRLLSEHALEGGEVKGTGRGGRVTADDVTRHAGKSAVQAPDTRIAHTAIRRRVAEHMARSLADAPHVTTLFEADMTRVLKHRSLFGANYASRGTRLTLTAYFISACVRALREHPEVNATFHEDALELHAEVNIGVGTALGSEGLIVPVIHGAQTLSLFALAKRLNQLVESSRAGTLAREDVRGGSFTISNHGVGGSLLAAPIVINQPQVAILGIGKLQRRVCVVEAGGEESIAVRSMCYLTLTIDHRALDAFKANAFLSTVVAALEQWPDKEDL